jgi:hypothetical protein
MAKSTVSAAARVLLFYNNVEKRSAFFENEKKDRENFLSN